MLTHVTNFVIHVTKFVTNFFCADNENYQAGRKNLLGDNENYLADSGVSFPDFTRHFLLLLSETVDSFFMPY